jgi:hypothetical protein
MRRRDLLALLGIATAWPLDALALERPVLVGFLSSGSSNAYEALKFANA